MADEKAGDVQELMLETLRIQLATVNAGIAFWSGWVESASKFSLAATEEMVKIRDNGDDSSSVGRLTDLSRGFLREMTELPEKAAAQFSADVVKGSSRRKQDGPSPARPPRAAKAKT